MKKILAPLLYSLLIHAVPVYSLEFEGIDVAETVNLANTDTELVLNGVGMRTKFIFDVYIGALYLEQAASSRDEVQQLSGPKRVMMHFVYDEVGADKLVDGWNEGFEDNQSAAQLAQLGKRIETFNAMFSSVRAGDVIYLDYVPARGTLVTIRDELKGVVEGEDFYRALLDIWLGEEPADEDLKHAMLRSEPEPD